MNSQEAKTWFEKHPFGTLRDSDGDLWRLRIAPKAGDSEHEIQYGNGDRWCRIADIEEFDDTDFVIESYGSRLDADQAEAWLRADPSRRLTDADGDVWGIDEDGAFYEERAYGFRHNVVNIRNFADGAYWLAPAEPSTVMNWDQAEAWMFAHPGEVLVDNTGDLHRVIDGRRQVRCPKGRDMWTDSYLEWREFTYQIANAVPATPPAPPMPVIATIGAAIDWLLANPGKTLVDNDGDEWRLGDGRVQYRTRSTWYDADLDPDWSDLTWSPKPAEPELPALPAGARWGKDDGRVAIFYDLDDEQLSVSIASDFEASVFEALIAEYRARRPK